MELYVKNVSKKFKDMTAGDNVSLRITPGVWGLTSILYALIDFVFLSIGNISIWLPYVMVGMYIIEIPVFIVLTIYSYTTHDLR